MSGGFNQFTIRAESRHPWLVGDPLHAATHPPAYDAEAHRYNPAYVSASSGLFILCDARPALSPTTMLLARPSVSIGGPERIFNPGDIVGFDPIGPPVDPSLPPLPPLTVPENVLSYRWSVQQLSGGSHAESVLKERTQAPFDETSSLMAWHGFRVPSEGLYLLSLQVTLDDGSVLESERRFRLRHRLVVSIGDSYASGEGVPDNVGHTQNVSNLADQALDMFGSIPVLGEAFDFLNLLNSGDEFCESATFIQVVTGLLAWIQGLSGAADLGAADLDEVAHVLHALFEWSSQRTTGVGVGWQEPFAHRSYRSGPSLAAEALETLDHGDVVTFLSFARSGSKIDQGLLGPREEDGEWNPIGQIEEIRQTVGDRPIDALLVSIGGNDTGFASGLTGLVKGDGFVWFLADASDNRSEVEAAARARIANLPEQFAQLAAAIASLSIAAEDVYITEYPEALFDDPRTQSGVNGGCGIFEGPNLNIDSEDAQVIKNLARHLNDQIQAAADTHGWHYVDGIVDGFGGHGYCSGQSFYVFAEDSCRQQGDFEGVMHPTYTGNRIYAQRIADTLRPRLFPRTIRDDVVAPGFVQPPGSATPPNRAAARTSDPGQPIRPATGPTSRSGRVVDNEE